MSDRIKIPPCWLTTCIAILAGALYHGIGTPTLSGGIGIVALVFMLTFGFEAGLYKITKFRFEMPQGLALIGAAAAFAVFAIALPQAAFTQIALSLFILVIITICAWSAFRRTSSRINRISIIAMLGAVYLVFLYGWQNIGSFSPDSYSYYELAQSFSGEFGLVRTIRQYVVKSDYGCSFPYFYPLCIFAVNKITQLGIYSGVILNIYIILYTLLLFLKISLHFTKHVWCGIVAGAVLLTTESYLVEAFAARAVPLAIMVSLICISLCADLFIHQKKDFYKVFIAGLCAGANMVTRFDGIALFVFCGLLMPFIQKENKWKNTLIYLGGALILLLPWGLYSWIHFHTLWISDNNGTIFLIKASTPNTVRLPNESVQTFFNAPLAWLAALLPKAKRVVPHLLFCSTAADFILTISACRLIYHRKTFSKKSAAVLFSISIFYVGKTMLYIAVGYSPMRYHAETVIFMTCLFLMACAAVPIKIKWKNILCIAIAAALVTAFSFKGNIANVFTQPAENQLTQINIAPTWVRSLDKELNEKIADKKARILCVGMNGFEFGGETNWRVYVDISGGSKNKWNKIEYAMKTYMDLNYVLLKKDYEASEEIYKNLDALYPKTELTDYWLFKTK